MKVIKLLVVTAMMSFCVMQLAAVEKGWLTNFENAKKIAAEKKIPILVDFSGSDWCVWCQKLDKEVFSQKKFQDYVKGKFVLLMIDFPRAGNQSLEEKQLNRTLAQKYEIMGFPTVLILDAKGKEIGRTSYLRGGPNEFIKYLNKFTTSK